MSIIAGKAQDVTRFTEDEYPDSGVVAITAEIDMSEFFEIARQFPKAANKALVRTLNKVGAQGFVALRKGVRAVFNIKDKRLKAAMVIIKAKGNDLDYEIISSGRRIGLINFGARQTNPRRPASVSVIKGRRTKLKHAFIATMPGGNRGVFTRTSTEKAPRKGRYKGRSVSRGPRQGSKLQRQVLKRLTGPGVTLMASNQAAQDAFIKRVEEQFPLVWEREIAFELNKIKPKGKK